MQLTRLAPLALALCLAAPQGAQAVCSLALGTGGTLGLSADARVLGSQELGGAGASLTIVSIGSSTITVSAPMRSSAPPPGYSTAQEQVQGAYAGLGLLSVISQPYSSQATQFSVGTIGLSTLVIHNRILNAEGFAPGQYTTRTVITCS